MRIVALAATLLALNVAVASAQAPVPPDIQMEPPFDLQVTPTGGSSYLAFGSKVINKGPGVLKVVGERSAMEQRMRATQILLDHHSIDVGKPVQTNPAGQFEFSPSADHNHWHYLRFEDYNLLTVPDLELAAPTRKTGFCLLGLDEAFWCGHQQPDLLEIGGPLDYDNSTANPNTQAMGMVVENGWDVDGNHASEDTYGPTVEGQDIDITDLASGRYCLSFVANPEKLLIENGDGKNNGASKLIDIGGTPGATRTVSEVSGGETRDSATCGLTKPVPDPPVTEQPPDTTNPGGGETQPGGGTQSGGSGTTSGASGGSTPNDGGSTPAPVGLIKLSRTQTSHFALMAIKRALTGPRGVARSCTVQSTTKGNCRVTFKLGGASYRGAALISQRLRAATGYWFYALKVTRVSLGRCERSRACPRSVKTKWLLGGAVGSNSVAARRALRRARGAAVPVRPGVAWPDSMLPPSGKAQVRAYKPVG